MCFDEVPWPRVEDEDEDDFETWDSGVFDPAKGQSSSGDEVNENE